MNNDYFNLQPEIQKSLLEAAANQLKVSDIAIEKDIWVCWVLKQLFSLPISMSFKGGTSLSKAYNLIHRFSEDVDITIDYRNFMNTIDFGQTSRSKLKRASEELKINLAHCINKTILPFLNQQVLQLPHKESFNIEFDNKEELRFYYPTALSDEATYLKDHVLIEFGVKNSTEPYERRKIKSLLSQLQFEKSLALPEADVDVLSVIRTFWEKATLIHVECHRKRLRENSDRLSRHWYDLAMLINAGLDKEALAQRNILESVVEYKKAFFNASYTNYDDCLNQKFRLIPDKDDQVYLRRDYEDMVKSGMFSEDPLTVEEIFQRLTTMEYKLNDLSNP